MINISEFKIFLNNTFSPEIIYLDEFKPDLQFLEINCFDNQPIKLAIELSPESIKMSAIDKEPAIDFSSHDYSFDTLEEAEAFVLRIKNTGKFPKRKY